MTAVADLDPLASWVEWGVASRAIASETESGDGYVLARHATGFLAAVVDGLGHGPDAARAAGKATETLRRHAGEPIADLVERCHKDVHQTRGVVLGLASFAVDCATMTWLSVGNVEGVLFRGDPAAAPARESLMLRGGVVGWQLPPMRPAALPVAAGDILILATDGIASGFNSRAPGVLPAPAIADRILAQWGKPSDDALVLVLRYLGGSS